ncbi:latrophilin Cirl-like isoform X1 [Acropora muricata]|nr:latrophilin Cirl-like isoform X1 [Acropora millepora]
MLKATCTVLALLLLAIQLPELSSAKKARNGIKVKNFRLNSKKNLGRVLSIVSAVDLTLRFTHGRIGVIESSVKHLKRVNKNMMNRLKKMDKKVDNIMRIMRKVMKGDKPRIKPHNLSSFTICEGRAAKLICKAGRKMKIVQARYGRSNKRTCKGGPIRTTKCKATKSLVIVRKYCQRKASCVLRANNSVFGDPCYGTYKYLTVKYRCSK